MTSGTSSALADLRARLGPDARAGEPLLRHTSYRIGGPADVFLAARSVEALTTAISAAAERGIPWRIIGSASNLLVSDDGVEGLVVKPMIRGMRLAPAPDGVEVLIHAEAACMLAAVARKAVLHGLAGLEWAASVPGTVGAAVVNNSGAFGSSVSACLVSAHLFLPGEGIRLVTPLDLGYEYRGSHLKQGPWRGVVVEACLRTWRSDAAPLRERLHQVEQLRRTTQPLGPSVGSVFRNPPDHYAGALIEAAGLKGKQLGGAQISTLHANFILNVARATARDVYRLIREVQETVWQRDHVWLMPEIELVGRWADSDRRQFVEPPTPSD
jgi:UDP-N-acetylmuramate dehydrogenase